MTTLSLFPIAAQAKFNSPKTKKRKLKIIRLALGPMPWVRARESLLLQIIHTRKTRYRIKSNRWADPSILTLYARPFPRALRDSRSRAHSEPPTSQPANPFHAKTTLRHFPSPSPRALHPRLVLVFFLTWRVHTCRRHERTGC
jgi:hypothetical protein